MLDKMFLQILNMSFTASIVILFVLVARLLLKNASKNFSYALWSVVLFRLICPYSFESIFSLLPTKVTPISENIVYMTVPKIDTGISAINNAVNTSLPAATPYASVNPLQIWMFLGRTAWLMGIAILLLYSIVSLLRLHKQLRNIVHIKENIYLAEGLETAFVMGLFRPKIYLPTTLSMQEKRYIFLHEETHIKRFDHVVKFLSFLVLCLHWFNPLVWLAFFLSNKDMEMSCDEAVIKKMGNEVKKEYSSSLLSLATGKRIVGGIPLAFGEGDTKDRIKNVLNYKKPSFWVITITIIAVIIVGIGLTTNPINSVRLLDAKGVNFLPENIDTAIYGALTTGNQVMDFSAAKVPEFTDFITELRVDKKEVTLSWNREQNSINQIHLVYEGFGNDGTDYNVYFKFNHDFSIVWLDNDVNPSPSYRVKNPKEVKTFFERQLGSVTQIMEIGSAEELWKARTKYVGDNSAVGKLLGLMPLPKGLHHNSFKLYTVGVERGLEWLLDEAENATYPAEDLNQSALLLFALIDNLEDFYVSIKDPFDRGTELRYDRQWANQKVGCDVRDYAESPEKLQQLINMSFASYEPRLLAGYMFIEGNTLYLDEVEIIKTEDEGRIAELGLIADSELPDGYYIHNPVAETISIELTAGRAKNSLLFTGE